jgi:Bacterial Ig-like domain (group 2)
MRRLHLAPAAVAVWLALSCSDNAGPGPEPTPPRTDAVGVWDASITGLPGSDSAGQPAICASSWIMTIEPTDTGPVPLISMRVPYTGTLRCGENNVVRFGVIGLETQFIVRQSGDTVAFLEAVTLDSFLVAQLSDSSTLTGRLVAPTIPGVAFTASRRSDTIDPNRAPYAASIQIPYQNIEAGDTMTVTPEVYDAYFERIAHPAVTWSASPTSYATIDEDGLIHAIAPGFANIRFAIDSLVQGFTLIVEEPAASVEITGTPATLAVSDTAVLESVGRDADGEVLFSRRFYWTSSDPGVATVSPYGDTAVLTGVALGVTTIRARNAVTSASVTIEVQP